MRLQAREQLRQVRTQCRDLTNDLDVARRQAAVRSSRSAVKHSRRPPFSIAFPNTPLLSLIPQLQHSVLILVLVQQAVTSDCDAQDFMTDYTMFIIQAYKQLA